MNNNIKHKIINYTFPEKLCLKCNNSLIEKSFIFEKIKKIKIDLCDYHKTFRDFSKYVEETFIPNLQVENIFSDNSHSFHNIYKIKKDIFKDIVRKILHKNLINKYHFCCDGNGVMYYL
jgi:hypothetical protein